jgi:hypothetical protein
MACKVCEFWAREGDFESEHHSTCPHALLAERLRGIQVKTAYETTIRNAAVDELERLKAAEIVGRVNEDGKVDFIPPYRNRRRVDFGSMRLVYPEQFDPEVRKRAKELSELMDRKVRELIEGIPPEILKSPEQTREQIKKDLQAARTAGWVVLDPGLSLEVRDSSVTVSKLPDEPVTISDYRTAPPDADEPVIRGG